MKSNTFDAKNWHNFLKIDKNNIYPHIPEPKITEHTESVQLEWEHNNKYLQLDIWYSNNEFVGLIQDYKTLCFTDKLRIGEDTEELIHAINWLGNTEELHENEVS